MYTVEMGKSWRIYKLEKMRNLAKLAVDNITFHCK